MVRRFYMLKIMIYFANSLTILIGMLVLSSAPALGTSGTQDTQKRPDAPQLAPYVPTGHDVVDRMLSLAGVTKADFVVDLGCGDGRIPIAAAKKYGARGLGVDIDPVRIQEANANLKAAGVQHLVEFRLQDALTTDVTNATVVTTFLLSASNLRLRPILTKQLKPGARIVTNTFSMGDWTPAKTDTFVDATGRTRTLYLYVADGKVRQ
jgi:SAM-dependent methyltransferase